MRQLGGEKAFGEGDIEVRLLYTDCRAVAGFRSGIGKVDNFGRGIGGVATEAVVARRRTGARRRSLFPYVASIETSSSPFSRYASPESCEQPMAT